MMGKGFGSQEVFHVPEEDKGYILDNTGSIGDHVCVWTMQTKSYNKLVSQFETRRGLGSFRGHMADNANCRNKHLHTTFDYHCITIAF